jgi:hypothetical protein
MSEIKGNVSISKKSEGKKELPKGAIIVEECPPEVTIEKIENGYLTVKNQTIKYKMKASDSYCEYCYTCKKWYSENDPISIETDDKELADLFE